MSRVWVITGANSGFGLALASHVLAQGDRVIATVRSISKFPQGLKDAGATPLILDLNAPEDTIKQTGREAIRVHGHVDVLVNNAGTLGKTVAPVEELNINDVKDLFQTNFFGAIAFTQPFLEHFRVRRAGDIINISSSASYTRRPSWSAYAASKAAIEALSDSLQTELTPYGVRVLTFLPGYFPTNIFAPQALSKIYTDPVVQGYDSVNRLRQIQHAEEKVGDPAKLAARIFEVVTGTGLAEGMDIGVGEKREWNKIPLGPDSGERILGRLEITRANVDALEAIWRSTNTQPGE